MRVRSGECSMGDFNAIIAPRHSTRSWELLALIGGSITFQILLGMVADDRGDSWGEPG